MKSHLPRLHHILDAAEVIREIIAGQSVAELSLDQKHMMAFERAFEIISEASRHLPDDLKARHQGIPWRDVANLGNVMRHAYDAVEPVLLFNIAIRDLPLLEEVCRSELAASGTSA